MNKMNTLTIIALALIFLGGIGAILLTIGQSVSSSQDKSDIINTTKEENKNLKQDITELKKERNELSETLIKRDEILQQKNDTIIQLSNKLSERSMYLQNYLTGGNGYPTIEIEKFSTEDFNNLTGMFNVRSVSEFPIYNLVINIYDYDKLANSFKNVKYSKNPIVTSTDFNNAKIISYNSDELSPSQSHFLDKKVKLTEVRYFIQLKTRSNVFIEKMASINHRTILYFSSQVYTLDGQLLEQSFGDNTPEEVQKKLLEKLSSIPIKSNFDLTE